MRLESVGRVLAGGFGDRVLVGTMLRFLDGVTPERCYEYISGDTFLLQWLPEDRWGKYRGIAKGVRFDSITSDDIIDVLRKHRLDLLSIIINHPDGRSWLDKQVIWLKSKLTDSSSS